MTLEEAQEQIVDLQQQLTERTNERDTLSQDNESLKGELEKVRTLNQKYFNQLTAQYAPAADPQPEADSESLEEFARKIKF